MWPIAASAATERVRGSRSKTATLLCYMGQLKLWLSLSFKWTKVEIKLPKDMKKKSYFVCRNFLPVFLNTPLFWCNRKSDWMLLFCLHQEQKKKECLQCWYHGRSSFSKLYNHGSADVKQLPKLNVINKILISNFAWM